MPSIKIVRLDDGSVAFQPDVFPEVPPGTPLTVRRGARVNWNNQTSDAHWPWPIDRDGNLLTKAQADAYGFYLTDEIPGGHVSDPVYNVDPIFSAPVPPGQRRPPPGVPPPPPPEIPPDTINYVCKSHLNDGGPIIVGGRTIRGGQIIVQEV